MPETLFTPYTKQPEKAKIKEKDAFKTKKKDKLYNKKYSQKKRKQSKDRKTKTKKNSGRKGEGVVELKRIKKKKLKEPDSFVTEPNKEKMKNPHSESGLFPKGMFP